ncbi:hypothetical protein B566_EDAN011593 [Ephemera danica]|nr:hypothetical protein B566_EDAN011593 [Ephemera danica]
MRLKQNKPYVTLSRRRFMWPSHKLPSVINVKMSPRWRLQEDHHHHLPCTLVEQRRPENGNSSSCATTDNSKSGSQHVRHWARDMLSSATPVTSPSPTYVISRQEPSPADNFKQVETAVVHSSTTPSEHRTLVCTALSRDIEVKLDEIEVLDFKSSSPESVSDCELAENSRRRHLAGGKVLMDRGDDALLTQTELEQLEFAELDEHMAREEDGISLQWDRGGARLVWRALQLCCSERGAKSPSAVPLPDDHSCDLGCLRDHASRMLEVCAPTRELWRSFGWAGLTVDAVLHKVLREDVLPHVALLPSVPGEVSESLRRIEACQVILKQLGSARDLQDAEDDRPSGSEAPDSSTIGLIRRKRGRPAKTPTINRRRLERVFLWRFLLELLDDSRLSGCLRWVQREDGIFRILNTDMLARLWGRRHGNPRMTYEKMARAMRTYYRSRVLLPVPRARNLPRKLVYRFSPSILQRVQCNSDATPRSNVTTHAARSLPCTYSNLPHTTMASVQYGQLAV